MAVDLEAVKLYCRIDGNEEDALLLTLMDAAAEYLEGAGVAAPEKPDPLYDLAVKALVLDYYDHRGRTETGTQSQIPGLDNAIVQLKLRAEAARIVEEVGDGIPDQSSL